MLRGRLGCSRIDERLVGDVNLRCIPRLTGSFRIDSERSIGGAAPKVFVVFDTPRPFEESYIAKAPSKPNATACECVTEHLICCIGRLLPLKVAQSRIAILPPDDRKARQPDVRFMSRVFLKHGAEHLRHGIELVAASFSLQQADVLREIPPGGAKEREFYTVDLIANVLQQVARNEAEYQGLRDSFARMLAFDALLGTNDRHAENWGVVENVLDRNVPLRFAPIYDTARALFWQRTDEQLKERASTAAERKALIENYANKSAPLITAGVARDTHFDVIEHVVGYRFDLACSVRQVISAFKLDDVRAMLHRDFRELLSRFRLELIDDLLQHRYAKLRSICRL